MIEVAIVGGGPAGSRCACCLAEEGIHTVIFDHTHPREKPCGGLLTPVALRLFPFLEKLPINHIKKTKFHLVSPSGKQTTVSLRKGKFFCFSRLELDKSLVDMAVDAGAKLTKERVTAIEAKKDIWKIKTTQRLYAAKLVVGADGVNSLVRRSIVGSLSKEDMGFCCGYLVKGIEKEDITFRFLAHRKGYIWVIPRYDHTSLGIGSSELPRSHGLRQELDLFFMRQYPHAKVISKWAALAPNIKSCNTLQIPVAGRNWMLIGDAAGHVNPLLGEGITYALLDGELAAQAVAEHDPYTFNELWKKAFEKNLLLGVKLRKWIYTRSGLELYCRFIKFENLLHAE